MATHQQRQVSVLREHARLHDLLRGLADVLDRGHSAQGQLNLNPEQVPGQARKMKNCAAPILHFSGLTPMSRRPSHLVRRGRELELDDPGYAARTRSVRAFIEGRSGSTSPRTSERSR